MGKALDGVQLVGLATTFRDAVAARADVGAEQIGARLDKVRAALAVGKSVGHELGWATGMFDTAGQLDVRHHVLAGLAAGATLGEVADHIAREVGQRALGGNERSTSPCMNLVERATLAGWAALGEELRWHVMGCDNWRDAALVPAADNDKEVGK